MLTDQINRQSAHRPEMLECLPTPPESSTTFSSHSPQLHLHPSPIHQDMDATSPGSSTSFTINLSRAYTAVLHSDSYKEMFRITSSMDQDHTPHQMIDQVLCPDRDRVLTALHSSKSNSLSNLNSSYFHFSEEITTLCLTLRRSVVATRRLYWPIHTLLRDLPIDSLSPSHCDLVFQEFVKFDEETNPFPGPDLLTFDEIRDRFSDLKRQLEHRLRKSSSRIRFVRPPVESSTICCSGGVFTAYIPPKFVKRELAYVAQLKVASINTYALKILLDTLDSLLGRLHNAVENDKRFTQLGLNMGNDQHTVQEVLKQLGKNYQNLGHFLDLFEQKICTCFTTVNRSRSQLLHQILLHQGSSESSHSQ